MKTLKNVLAGCIAGASLLLASCTPSAVDTLPKAGYGNVSFGVKANAGFSDTRAVNEDDYRDENNYTVEIWLDGENDEPAASFPYYETASSIKLANGSYTMKAFYGEKYKDKISSQDGFYVVGTKSFVVNADNQKVNVNCTPICGRVKTIFDSSMSENFSNYYVEYETEALADAADGTKITWSKDETDPYYLKLNKDGETVRATIYVTRIDGKSSTVSKAYTMKPNQSWTMNIAPKDGAGSLGLEITIDESTNETEKHEIVIPSDWM